MENIWMIKTQSGNLISVLSHAVFYNSFLQSKRYGQNNMGCDTDIKGKMHRLYKKTIQSARNPDDRYFFFYDWTSEKALLLQLWSESTVSIIVKIFFWETQCLMVKGILTLSWSTKRDFAFLGWRTVRFYILRWRYIFLSLDISFLTR